MTYFTTFEAPDAGFRLVAGRPHGLQRLLVASGRLPAGQPGPMHLHAGDEVLRILSGELIVRVGDQRRTCRADDLVIIPPNTLSRWRHGFKSRWDYQGKRIVGVLVSTLVKVQTRAAKAQVKPAEQAGSPVSRPASVPQTTSPRHGTGRD